MSEDDLDPQVRGDLARATRPASGTRPGSWRRTAQGPLVAVASAMGGVTDVLLAAAREAERGRIGLARKAVEALRTRATPTAARELGVALRRGAAPRARRPLSKASSLLRERTARVTDLVSSFGERLSAPLLAAALAKIGRPGARGRRPRDARHGRPPRRRDVRPQEERPAREAPPQAAPRERRPPVVTGFIARSAQGETTTLGRSGSDTTAALLGRGSRREGGRHLDGRGRRPVGRPAPRQGRAAPPAPLLPRGGGDDVLRREGPALPGRPPRDRRGDPARDPQLLPAGGPRHDDRGRRATGDPASAPSPRSPGCASSPWTGGG